jgi:hypothetical protein
MVRRAKRINCGDLPFVSPEQVSEIAALIQKNLDPAVSEDVKLKILELITSITLTEVRHFREEGCPAEILEI